MRIRYVLPLLIFAGMIALFMNGLTRDPTIVESPFIGKPAPAFELPNLFNPNETMRHTDMFGEVSMFNIWASWCPGCAQEHELLMALGTQSDVPLYGLNWKDERPAALKWLEQRGNPYKAVAVDRNNITGIDWGVYGAPETFLLDADGIILYKLVGPMTPEIWLNEFVPRIAAARGETTADNAGATQ
ncbi:MAG: DsbE family thiol:disulfide interchange protein [Gammaproteobacteria bacterium]|nr:DsbE family thiol:disulfide interchange protein [Gammaproteobacteria bacterium]